MTRRSRLGERVWPMLWASLTMIFVSFFMVWLPHEAAGLSFIGLEMGEQVKFLPQVRSGEIVPGRSLFYLPVISIAVTLLLVSARWPRRRWQTWVLWALAVGTSLLAFPTLEALGTEAAEWLWRVLMIAGVVVLALLNGSGVTGRVGRRAIWMLVAVVGTAGAVLPTWTYLAVRPAFETLLDEQVGVGPGVWLNLVGHVALVGLGVAVARR